MLLPFLDSVFVGYNNPKADKKVTYSKEEAVELLYKAFTSAAERDIYTGDKVEIVVIDKDGVTREERPLRKD
jgi:20S proteasome subunit beta 6